MKKFLLIVTCFSFFVFTAVAQESNQKGGRIEALKIAYLTKKLDLSPAEAQKFWPIYNDYSSEMRSTRADLRQNKVSELEAEDRMLKIRKKYGVEFSHAISDDKINTFFRSEKEFGQYVQKELQQRRELRQQRNP